MFIQLLNKYRAWRLVTQLERYELQLQNIDLVVSRYKQYLVDIKEYWRLFDMDLLDKLTTRDLMGHADELRHIRFTQLSQLLLDANDAIAHQQDSRLEYILRTQLSSRLHKVDLGEYFLDANGAPVGVRESFEQVRQLLQAQCGILENLDDDYSPRIMLHVYYDILRLSELMLDVIHAKGVEVYQ